MSYWSPPLPPNWEARKCNGIHYFINHEDKTTTWADPRWAPPPDAESNCGHPEPPPSYDNSLDSLPNKSKQKPKAACESTVPNKDMSSNSNRNMFSTSRTQDSSPHQTRGKNIFKTVATRGAYVRANSHDDDDDGYHRSPSPVQESSTCSYSGGGTFSFSCHDSSSSYSCGGGGSGGGGDDYGGGGDSD